MKQFNPSWNMRRWLVGVGIVLVAVAVRLPGITAAWPYSSYIDEGQILHPVVNMLARESWIPGVCIYPPPIIELVALACRLYAPFYAAYHGHDLATALSPSPCKYYDFIWPPELFVCGRLTTLLISIGLVLFVGLLAARLAGWVAGCVAAWWATLAPPLVYHSHITVQDPLIALLAIGAFWAVEAFQDDGPRWRSVFLAGFLAGCSAGTKFTTVFLILAIVTRLFMAAMSWRKKWTLALGSGIGFALGLLLCLAPMLIHPRALVDSIRFQWTAYKVTAPVTIFYQMFKHSSFSSHYPDVGYAAAILLLVAVIVALAHRRWRPMITSMLVFFVLTELLFCRFPYRPFRNQLPFVALSCVIMGLISQTRWKRIPAPILPMVVIALPIVLFSGPLKEHLQIEWNRSDSRRATVDWLVPKVKLTDEILIDERLAILPSELARLKAQVYVVNGNSIATKLNPHAAGWMVWSIPVGKDIEVLQETSGRQIAQFGRQPVPAEPLYWRGNDVRVNVFRIAARRDAQDGSSRLPAQE